MLGSPSNPGGAMLPIFMKDVQQQLEQSQANKSKPRSRSQATETRGDTPGPRLKALLNPQSPYSKASKGFINKAFSLSGQVLTAPIQLNPIPLRKVPEKPVFRGASSVKSISRSRLSSEPSERILLLATPKHPVKKRRSISLKSISQRASDVEESETVKTNVQETRRLIKEVGDRLKPRPTPEQVRATSESKTSAQRTTEGTQSKLPKLQRTEGVRRQSEVERITPPNRSQVVTANASEPVNQRNTIMPTASENKRNAKGKESATQKPKQQSSSQAATQKQPTAETTSTSNPKGKLNVRMPDVRRTAGTAAPAVGEIKSDSTAQRIKRQIDQQQDSQPKPTSITAGKQPFPIRKKPWDQPNTPQVSSEGRAQKNKPTYRAPSIYGSYRAGPMRPPMMSVQQQQRMMMSRGYNPSMPYSPYRQPASPPHSPYHQPASPPPPVSGYTRSPYYPRVPPHQMNQMNQMKQMNQMRQMNPMNRLRRQDMMMMPEDYAPPPRSTPGYYPFARQPRTKMTAPLQGQQPRGFGMPGRPGMSRVPRQATGDATLRPPGTSRIPVPRYLMRQ